MNRRSSDHRAYSLLGDAYQNEGRREECTAAYLRAWRLADRRSPDLGLKLAEALSRSGHDAAATTLTSRLNAELNRLDVGRRRRLSVRLDVIQARLDIKNHHYEAALQKLKQKREK